MSARDSDPCDDNLRLIQRPEIIGVSPILMMRM